MRKQIGVMNQGASYGFPLSKREREITGLVATGASNKEISRELGVSIKTVKNILTKVFAKTGTRSRTELAIQVVRQTLGVTAEPKHLERASHVDASWESCKMHTTKRL